jgi:P-type Cu2+ transporter
MWAFGYNLVAVGLAMVGLLQPVLAAAVMAGSSIVVVLNSLRLERLPEPVPLPQPGHRWHAEAEITPALCTSGIAVVAGQAVPGVEQRPQLNVPSQRTTR